MTRVVLIVFAMCVSGLVFAHQDFAGDVHPKVKVAADRFIIEFSNNQDKGHYRTEVGPDGVALSERKAVADPGLASLFMSVPRLEQGVVAEDEGRVFVFPEWRRKHQGRPRMHRLENGKIAETVDLPLTGLDVDIVHAAAVRGPWVFVLLTVQDSKDLWLLRFGDGGRKLAGRLKVGAPRRIYSFPRASNLGLHGKEAVVAWISEDAKLMLTRFRPDSGQRFDVVLQEKISWNTSLSLGVLGDVLLVAWHGLSGQGPGAKIRWMVRKLLSENDLDK